MSGILEPGPQGLISGEVKSIQLPIKDIKAKYYSFITFNIILVLHCATVQCFCWKGGVLIIKRRLYYQKSFFLHLH